ncbi:mitochondrial import receptor subunit TOM22-like [Tropilaelaps mercedesae]|uniref:Mitochondrial import receptor subunit TOM22 homolog n=1 Tax=Tropilaelaps mercedesae TaxID=418985 RepID=A0A1V9XXS2_9ACAR|nr:mitochondrial import receptor subunit TOM22-like [Tropilaelaps mercedesae]
MFGDADEQVDSGFETVSVPDSPAGMDRGVGDIAAKQTDGADAIVPAGQIVKKSRADLGDSDDDVVETIGERLWGLTEMFPDSVRDATRTLTSVTHTALSKVYGLSRTLIWVFFSSAAILAAPVIVEVERVNMDEMAKQQQREILLGPSAAVAGHK